MKYALLLALVAGCGSLNDAGENDVTAMDMAKLQGGWLRQLSPTCVMGFVFKDTQYEVNTACVLLTLDLGLETTSGTFSLNSNQIVLSPKQATCPDVEAKPHWFGYGVSESAFSLKTETSVTVFERPSKNGGGVGASAAFGCFDVLGKFSPMPVHPVR